MNEFAATNRGFAVRRIGLEVATGYEAPGQRTPALRAYLEPLVVVDRRMILSHI